MITAIIQARTSSTRLPRKALMEVCGLSLLEHEILRIKRARLLDKIIVATTDKKQDDLIVSIAKKTGVEIFRGSENDVLDRYYRAAVKFKVETIVRLTGDCPLLDPKIIDKVIKYYLDNREKFDYVSNVRPGTYPDGMDVEVFSFDVLKRNWQRAKLSSEREHVMGYLAKNLKNFKVGNVENDQDLGNIRLTVDELRDWQLIRQIFKRLYPKNRDFGLNEIMDFLMKNPELLKINSGIIKNEGHLKSLSNDLRKKIKI